MTAKTQIVQPNLLQQLKPELEKIVSMKAPEGFGHYLNVGDVKQTQDKFEFVKQVLLYLDDLQRDDCYRC